MASIKNNNGTMRLPNPIKDPVFSTLAIFLIIIVFSSFMLIIYTKDSIEYIKEDAKRNLLSISRTMSSEVGSWYSNHKMRAKRLFMNNIFINEVIRLNAIEDAAARQKFGKDLLAYIKQAQALSDYSNILLVSSDGKTIFAANNESSKIIDFDRLFLEEALAKRDTVVSPMHILNDKRTCLDVVAPLMKDLDTGGNAGFVVARTDPATALFSKILTWPIETRTGESLLVGRDGDRVVFLNRLRHINNIPLELSIPIDKVDVPAVKAVLGYNGIVEGKDYRGVPVIAAVTKIEGAPWFLVTKMDRSELYWVAARSIKYVTIIITLMGLLFGSVISIFLYRRTAESYRRQRDAEVRFKQLFDTMKSGVVIYGPTDGGSDFIIKDCNPAVESIEKESREDIIGRKVSEAFPGIKTFGLLEVFTRVFRTGVPEQFPLKFYKDSRIAGWRDNRIYKLPSGDIVALYDDVTEMKRLEDERNRLFNLSVDMLGIADFDGYFLEVNPAWTKNLGWSKEDILSKPFIEFVHPDDRAVTVAVTKDLYDGKTTLYFQNRYITKDGSYKWLSWNSSALPEEKLIFAVARDITPLKEAQEQLLQSERQYRMLFENNPSPMLIFDQETFKFLAVNDAAVKHYGYSRKEFLNMGAQDIRPEEDVESFKNIVATLEEKVVSVGERRHRKKDGAIIYVDISAIRIDFIGKKAIFALVTDITQQKITENNIRNINKILEAKVAERTRDLELSNKELEAFSYSVSHDLRAPLRSMDGFAQALVEDFADKLDSKGKDYIHRIRMASQHMSQLIDDLLSLSRIVQARISMEKINISKVVSGIASRLREEDPGRNVQFVITPDIFVMADPGLITIAMQDLMNNAWKFTSKHPAAKIEFGQMVKDGDKVFFLRDDGAGFDMAYSNKLFAPFQRLHNNVEFDGTGIGLVIVNRIISRHGGRVWAEGMIEKGATVYFTLPHSSA